MAPKSKIPVLIARPPRVARRVIRRRRLNPISLTRRMVNLSLRGAPKLTPRRNFPARTNTPRSFNINSVSTLNGTERVATVTIPINTTPGKLLYLLENNPNSAPRAQAVATQFDSWHSVTELEVETTGNAFAKNFIVIRHVPNGDPSRIPTDPQSLLNFAEAYSRKGESFKLQLDSNGKGVVRAPWQGISYNPRKPINDTDPSERNNGLFIIVSNGSPGTDPVDITIRFRYSFKFYGPIYRPVTVNQAIALTNGTPTPAAPLTGAIKTGPGAVTYTNNTITFPEVGTYLLGHTGFGTGITSFSITAPLGTVTVTAATTGTILTAVSLLTVTIPFTVVTLAVTATSLTAFNHRSVLYDLSL